MTNRRNLFAELMAALTEHGMWNLCKEHDVPYPNGAKCPMCEVKENK